MEDLNAYVKRFHVKDFDCCDLVIEEVLMSATWHDKRVHDLPGEFFFLFLSRLMQVARCTNELVGKTSLVL